MNEKRYKPIEVGENTVSFEAEGQRHEFPRVRLPQGFVDWVIEGRHAMYDLLEGKSHASFFGSHLPVVVTFSRDTSFPFNTGNKGVGLSPLPEKIDDYIELYKDTFRASTELPWEESLPMRLGAVRKFIGGADVSDEVLLSLEIFEKTTFANLCDFPIATLHYTGDGPIYRSYQINAVVQIVSPEHPAYGFAHMSRQLFEYDDFHITQTQFPYAYVFYPVEVKDKTPFPRRDAPPRAEMPREWSDMSLVWEEEVLAQLARAPGFVQKFIIRATEDYARQQGYAAVNLDMFKAVRARYMEQRGKSGARPVSDLPA